MAIAAELHLISPLAGCEPFRDYTAFGGVLRSQLEFPELPIARDCLRPDWQLMVEHAEPPRSALGQVGERDIGHEQYRLWPLPDGFRLEYSHAGIFDISRDGTRLIWYYRREAVPELVRSIALGPAIALAMELLGFLCLHASAVSIADRAVAFVGPKYFGKSTLATALTIAGARLLGDDLLVVNPGPPPTVRPGLGSVRLWSDMAARLPLETICERLIPGVKTTLTGFLEESLGDAPTLLRAVYVLAPVAEKTETRAVWRTRLSRVEAAIALAHQTKLPDSLVGLRGASSQLATAALVAANVEVYTLHIRRDATRLNTAVNQILEWSR